VFRCKVCDGLLKAQDIDLRTGIATCAYCHAVMRFEELASDAPALPAERPRIELPDRFTVDDSGGELTITRRWFSPAIIFLAFFCVFWDGFLIFWYVMGVAAGAPIIMFIFPLIHVGVGAGLTYFCVASFVNRTTITVGHGQLAIHHGPLPWPGGGNYETDELKQLYCEEKIRRGKNGPRHSYGLAAVTRDGRKLKLLSSVEDADQVLFLEQQIEDYLQIKDEAVAGELPR